jgi:glyoxylase-like metal-dependent hydrolase (beta-lactamase superfamily II)
MTWLRRIGMLLVVLLAVAGGAFWYLVADGSVPATSSYRTDIAGWRNLVAADAGQLPTEIRIDIVGRDTMPFMAAQGGGANVDFARVRAAFQLNGPAGSVIIDSTMDRDMTVRMQRSGPVSFNEAAYGRIIAAMGVAARVVVTHEHADHIGGVARFPVPERLAERLTLNRPQYEGLGSATPDGKIPPEFAKAQILDLTQPTRVAPGVVMIPAPGHTPGSAMFYVKLADGREVLFIGDIAWALSNITTPATRPRFISQFFLKNEDRAAVANEVRALHDLAAVEPALTILPAHDAVYIDQLISKGLLQPQFLVEAP